MNCKECRGTGLVIYIKKIHNLNYEFAARCTCIAGIHKKNLPYITEVFKTGEPIYKKVFIKKEAKKGA